MVEYLSLATILVEDVIEGVPFLLRFVEAQVVVSGRDARVHDHHHLAIQDAEDRPTAHVPLGREEAADAHGDEDVRLALLELLDELLRLLIQKSGWLDSLLQLRS